jgi:hypothetical protein
MNTRIAVFGVVIVGLWLITVSIGLIPVQPGTLHAPLWLLACIGVVFLLGGLLAATGSGGRLATGLAASLLSLLGLIGGWVAVFGNSAGFHATLSGGALAATADAPLPARIGFGIGALIVLSWAGYAWRQVFKLR